VSHLPLRSLPQVMWKFGTSVPPWPRYLCPTRTPVCGLRLIFTWPQWSQGGSRHDRGVSTSVSRPEHQKTPEHQQYPVSALPENGGDLVGTHVFAPALVWRWTCNLNP